ncbi:myosin-9-like, partial [Terrapene carolina triunguis]|uniref:myosin-9-like n=1 Tax=Terrapene triunguis TaxID=2587831 RepID=UPI00115680E3
MTGELSPPAGWKPVLLMEMEQQRAQLLGQRGYPGTFRLEAHKPQGNPHTALWGVNPGEAGQQPSETPESRTPTGLAGSPRRTPITQHQENAPPGTQKQTPTARGTFENFCLSDRLCQQTQGSAGQAPRWHFYGKPTRLGPEPATWDSTLVTDVQSQPDTGFSCALLSLKVDSPLVQTGIAPEGRAHFCQLRMRPGIVQQPALQTAPAPESVLAHQHQPRRFCRRYTTQRCSCPEDQRRAIVHLCGVEIETTQERLVWCFPALARLMGSTPSLAIGGQDFQTSNRKHLRGDLLSGAHEVDPGLLQPVLAPAWTLSRSSSQSPVTSQKEGPAWPVGNPAGDSEKHHGARRGPQEEPQLPGRVSRSPGLSTDDPFQPGLEESRAHTATERSPDNGRQAGSQQRGSEAAGDGKPEAELQRVNAQLQLQVEALGRELESMLVQQAQRHRQEQDRLEQEAAQRCSGQAEEQARQIRELQDSKAFLSDTLEEMDVLVSALRRQLSQREEETASLRAAQAQELAELQARHGARLAAGEKRQQELAERLSQATRGAEQEAAAAAGQRQEARAAAEALEEAERRLRAQEAERREYLAGAEAQELRHRQLLSRCQRLQEKLSASEGRLEETEAQVAALQRQLSPGQQEGPSGSPPLGPEEETAQRAALEGRLRQAEVQAEGLREKLERGLAEGRELEREREALLESAVSQGQSLAAARLEAQDLQKALAARQERNASLQAALEHAERALTDKEEGARGLQEELEGQSAKLRDALAENAAVASRLAEAAAGFAREKAQLEARGSEERAGHERAVAELKRRLAECEEQRRAEGEEKQQLQAVLRGASEERDVLAKQVQTTAAALESRAREAGELRDELEELRARSQLEDTRLQEALARQKEESDGQMVALRLQVQTLELEKQRAADTLEQARGQLAAVLAEKDALEETLARAAAELERA